RFGHGQQHWIVDGVAHAARIERVLTATGPNAERLHLAHFDAEHRQGAFRQATIEPWRKRTCFEPHAPDRSTQVSKAGADIIGVAGDTALHDNPAIFAEHGCRPWRLALAR